MKRLSKALLVAGGLLVLLGALEYGLRGAGVGVADQAVFQPLPGQPAYRQLNAAYLQRYFGYRIAPTVAFTPFRGEKAPGTFRVLVLGGSATAGFPYRFNLSFPARLQHRLEAFAAGQRIEVVNLGFFAASSYVWRDVKDALIAQAPDAVVLYAGHDAYYGVMGVGSALTAPGPRWWKRLRLRLHHLVLYRTLRRALAGTPRPADASLFFQSVRDGDLVLDGPAFRAGLAQYEANMAEMLGAFQQAGIPVYAGTLASNLKDQRPFGAAEAAREAYRRGQTLFSKDDKDGARAAFMSAKEHDPVRLRAPEAVNERLRGWAGEGLLTLVEIQPVAAGASPHGIEDEWFFHDHRHPDHRGYDAMAGAFFSALKGHPALVPGGLPAASEPYVPPDAFERGSADLEVARMRSSMLASPEEAEAVLQGSLKIYRESRHYLDSLVVQTFTGALSAERAVQTALRRARHEADTLRTLLFYRSLLHWRPFDEQAIEAAAAFARAADGVALLPLRREIILRVHNLTGDAAYLDALTAPERPPPDGLPR